MREQVLILKVRYDDEEKSPHTWDWSSLIGGDHKVEIMNYGAEETVKD